MSDENTQAEGEGYPEDAPQLGYAFRGEKIFRTDKDSTTHVANFKDGVLSIHPDHQKIKSAVSRWLQGEENELTVETIVLMGDEAQAAEEAQKRAVSPTVPPKPKMLRRFGDKTPALVEWYQRYAPTEYKARYGIIGPGTVTKFKKAIDQDTGETIDVPEQVHATLSRRKTHLTEKPETGDSADDMYED